MSTDLMQWLPLIVVVVLTVTIARVHRLQARRGEITDLREHALSAEHMRRNLVMAAEINTAIGAHKIIAAVAATTLLHTVIIDESLTFALIMVNIAMLAWLVIYVLIHPLRTRWTVSRSVGKRETQDSSTVSAS